MSVKKWVNRGIVTVSTATILAAGTGAVTQLKASSDKDDLIELQDWQKQHPLGLENQADIEAKSNLIQKEEKVTNKSRKAAAAGMVVLLAGIPVAESVKKRQATKEWNKKFAAAMEAASDAREEKGLPRWR